MEDYLDIIGVLIYLKMNYVIRLAAPVLCVVNSLVRPFLPWTACFLARTHTSLSRGFDKG